MKLKVMILTFVLADLVGCINSQSGSLEVYEPFALVGKKGRTIIPEGTSKAQIKKGLRNKVKLKIAGIDTVFELGVTKYLPSSGSINISSAASGQPVDLMLSGDKREIYSRVYESSRTCNVWKIVKVCQRGEGEDSCVFDKRSFSGFERVEIDETDYSVSFTAEVLELGTSRLLGEFLANSVETDKDVKVIQECVLLNPDVRDQIGTPVIFE